MNGKLLLSLLCGTDLFFFFFFFSLKPRDMVTILSHNFVSG